MGSFKADLIRSAQDGVLDRREWQALRSLGQKSIDQGQEDSWLAEHALPYLDQFKQSVKINYGIPGHALSFTFTPHYSEQDEIPGQNIREKLSHVAQKDTLADTQTEGSRCGAASLINSYLLQGGDMKHLATLFKLPDASMTYANLHYAQDRLYTEINQDNEDGLTSSYSYTHRKGNIESRTLTGEVAQGLAFLGLKGQILTGSTVNTLHQRQEAVHAFWRLHAEGTLLVGVHLDTRTGDLQAASDSLAQNHFVTVFKDGDKVYLLDTGASDNGAGNSQRQLSQPEIENFLYHNAGHVLGVHR